MAPSEVNQNNVYAVWTFMRNKRLKDKQFNSSKHLSVGDFVRIAKNKNMLIEKSNLPNFTDEIFKITQIVHRKPQVYHLSDENGPIDGVFYAPELQKVTKCSETLFRIEKILKRQTRGGVKMCFIKWMNQDKSKNSWIPASDIVDSHDR